MLNAGPFLLNSGYGNDVWEDRRQPRGLMYPYVRKNSEVHIMGDKKETLICSPIKYFPPKSFANDKMNPSIVKQSCMVGIREC